jgi:hypothetical protein
MGGCISNSYRVCGACTRKAPEDRDPTYVRIFGFFAFLSACIVIGLDTFVYAVVGLKYGVQLDLGNGFMLPVGAWWGGIFPFLAGFLAMFHGCRQGCFARCCCPAYCDPNRRMGLYNGPCGPCSCGKVSALLAAIGVVIALLGTVWDAFAGLVRCLPLFLFRWLLAVFSCSRSLVHDATLLAFTRSVLRASEYCSAARRSTPSPPSAARWCSAG